MLKGFLTPQFLAFLLTGGFAAIVNFCSRILYNLWLNYSWSVILAYITGMITAFALAKLFVFKESKNSLRHSAFWFLAVNAIAVLQTWGISVLLAFHVLPSLGIDFYNKELAHAVGVIFPVFTSYLGHKHLSFK
jgi:putative flippase GtrA